MARQEPISGKVYKRNCRDCGVVKTMKNTLTYTTKNGSVCFRHVCTECDAARVRERRWDKLDYQDIVNLFDKHCDEAKRIYLYMQKRRRSDPNLEEVAG